jgi:hypothetical protein
VDDPAIGLPEIDAAKAKELSKAGRATIAGLPAAAPGVARSSEKELRTWLKTYCQAWADLQRAT